MGDTTPNGRYLGQISDGQRSLQVTLEIDGSNLPEYLKGTLWGSAGQQDVLLEMEDGQQMSFEGFFGPDRLTCDKIWIQRAQHWSGCGDDESSLSCPLAEVDIERMKVANTLIRRANGPTLFHLTGPSCCWPINVSQKSSYEGWIKLDIHGGSLQLHDSVGVKASIIPFCFSDGHFSDKDGVWLRGHYALKLEEEKK
ncbi:MAG: hypothetical protein QUS33_09965, partial [Dehalococcoidia bacterium]|nr:hypothetical protein [Dehalococcoidia bacterium]